MAITLTPEMLLLINLLINNLLRRILLDLEGKTDEEIREMVAKAQFESDVLMRELDLSSFNEK